MTDDDDLGSIDSDDETRTTEYVTDYREASRQLDRIARQVSDEARLAEEKADRPDDFADERLVAVLELAYRVGLREYDGDDPRLGVSSRQEAEEWLRRCIDDECECAREDIQRAIAATLLAELVTP